MHVLRKLKFSANVKKFTKQVTVVLIGASEPVFRDKAHGDVKKQVEKTWKTAKQNIENHIFEQRWNMFICCQSRFLDFC